MKLNISELRRRNIYFDGSSLTRTETLQVLDIAEAAKRELIQFDSCKRAQYDTNTEVGASTYEFEVERLTKLRKESRRLLEDVEVGDGD